MTSRVRASLPVDLTSPRPGGPFVEHAEPGGGTGWASWDARVQVWYCAVCGGAWRLGSDGGPVR